MNDKELKILTLLDDAYREGFAKGSEDSPIPQDESFISIDLKSMSDLISKKTYIPNQIYIVEDEHNS